MLPEPMYQAMLDREPQDRHVRPRLHLFGSSGGGRGGAQDAGDLRPRTHRSSRPRARRRSSRRGSTRSAIIRWSARRAASASSAAVELVADKNDQTPFDPKAGVGRARVRFAEEEGLIVRFIAGDIVSICPPLIITPAEIDELFDRLGRALDRTLDWARRERLVDAV